MAVVANYLKKLHELPSQAWSANGKYSVQLNGIHDGFRIPHIDFEMSATVHNAAAGAVTVYPRQLASQFFHLFLESELASVRATGRLLWRMYKMQHGKSFMNGGVTIPGASDGMVRGYVRIPFAHPRALKPNDTAQDSTHIKAAKEIEVNFAPSGVIGSAGGGDQTVTAATVRHFVHYLDGAGDNAVQSEVKIDYAQWGQMTAFVKALKSMALSDMFIYDESDDVVTLTEYDHATLKADAKDLYTAMPTSALIADYNDRVVRGASQDNELEQLPTTGDLQFLPTYVAPEGFNQTQLFHAEDEFEQTFTGTALSQRLAYFGIRGTTESKMDTIAASMGFAPGTYRIEPRTAKGNLLTGDPKRIEKNAKLLPKRIVAK